MVPKPEDRLIPSQDEFDAWCEHPVTRFVAAAWLKASQAQLEAWINDSWITGKADPEQLITCRVRADAYNAFLETGLKDYANILGVDPSATVVQIGRAKSGSARRRPS